MVLSVERFSLVQLPLIQIAAIALSDDLSNFKPAPIELDCSVDSEHYVAGLLFKNK
jgi:hypothetical protein